MVIVRAIQKLREKIPGRAIAPTRAGAARRFSVIVPRSGSADLPIFASELEAAACVQLPDVAAIQVLPRRGARPKA